MHWHSSIMLTNLFSVMYSSEQNLCHPACTGGLRYCKKGWLFLIFTSSSLHLYEWGGVYWFRRQVFSLLSYSNQDSLKQSELSLMCKLHWSGLTQLSCIVKSHFNWDRKIEGQKQRERSNSCGMDDKGKPGGSEINFQISLSILNSFTFTHTQTAIWDFTIRVEFTCSGN